MTSTPKGIHQTKTKVALSNQTPTLVFLTTLLLLEQTYKNHGSLTKQENINIISTVLEVMPTSPREVFYLAVHPLPVSKPVKRRIIVFVTQLHNLMSFEET